MRFRAFIWFSKIGWFTLFILVVNCVERIEFEVPSSQFLLVVEGMISDKPGPYTIRLSQGLSLDADSSFRAPIQGAKIRLFDDLSTTEDFVEVSPGVYSTLGAMQGTVGRSYHVRIETAEGKIFESEPELLRPVGKIDAIRYEYESRTVVETYGEISADVFNVYVDATTTDEADNYVRWRFTGAFELITFPQFRLTEVPPYRPYKNPPPCSGYIVDEGPIGSGGLLVQVGECTCCNCWVTQYEFKPQLSDTQLINGKEFKNVKVAEIPITSFAFRDKFLIDIEQFSISRNAFEFFKLIREQKENASSLFQPPAGELIGNFRGINNGDRIIGLFWAGSVNKKSTFIYQSDVPYQLPPPEYITFACTNFANSSTLKPEAWDD